MKIINFFDGYTSSSTPTQIGIQNLVEYADDNSFVADNSGTPIAGNIYYNTTLNKVRYYTTEWLSISDEDDISSVMSTISALDVRVTNNESNIATNETTMNDFIATKNVADGIAPLDSSGKVPAINLPSYVDDVEEYADLSSFPVTGESGKLYVALDNLKQYRWSGTMYSEVSPSDVNSVNGYTGIVTLDKSDISLTNVTDDAQLKRESGDMNTFIEKEIPSNDDIVLIEDSEDSFSKKTVKLSNLLGSGQGGINHLDKNGDADNGIGDWQNGVTGSTIVTSETSPLRGSSSFIVTDTNTGTANDYNVMASCVFTIDRTDLNTTQWITFDFEELNSTFDSTQDCVVFIRENVSNDEIIVSNETIDGRSGQYIMRFQATNATEYKIEFVRNVNTTNVLTMEFKIDNIQIGPKEITRSIGKTSWSCQFGVNLDPNEFLNEGNIIKSITNPSSGVYRVYYNEEYFPSEPVAIPLLNRRTGTTIVSYYGLGVFSDVSGSYYEFVGLNSSNAGQNLNGDSQYQVTLTQKEEDQTAYQISTDISVQNINFSGGQPTANNLANTPILFSSVSDTTNFYNESLGQWTIQESGMYEFTGTLSLTGTGAFTLYLYVNGVEDIPLYSGGGYVIRSINGKRYLNKGDVIDIRPSLAISFVAANNYIEVTKQTNTIPLLAPILNDTYSTEEHRTGETWIDGRQVYRRVLYFDVDVATNTTITTWDMNLEIIDKHRQIGTNKYLLMQTNLSGASNRIIIIYDSSTGEITSESADGSGRIESGMSLIIKYVK